VTRRIAPRWLYLVTLAAVTWWLASPTTPDSFRVLAIVVLRYSADTITIRAI
jgi:hypothetical protein